jgi:hypothetical protein
MRSRHPPRDRSATLSRAVGLILDLAVVALAAAVIGSLALLTWTLAVNAVRSVDHGRAEVAAARRRVASVEEQVASLGGETSETLALLNRRFTTDR